MVGDIGRMSPLSSLLAFLGNVAGRFEGRYASLKREMLAARFTVTWRTYVARSYLYALVAFLVSTTVVALLVYGTPPRATPVLVGSGGVGSALLGYAVYRLRLYYPKYVADIRGDRIETTLPGVTSFMFALVRGGTPLSDVLRVVAENSDVFGEAAEEIAVAARDVEYFGVDVVTALEDVADDTPSEEMSEFLNNLVSIVVRKEDISDYLEEQARQFQEKSEEKQEKVLDRLGVLAEFYVVVFVAAPLFVITLLVVVGFIGNTTLVVLRGFVYVFLPLSGVGFVVLLDVLFGGTERVQYDSEGDDETEEDRERHGVDDEKLEVLRLYEKRKRFVEYLRSPVRSLKRHPRLALYLGAGLGFVYLVGKAFVYFVYLDGTVPSFVGFPTLADVGLNFTDSTEASIRAVDDTVFEAVMISLLVYSVFYQIRAEYLRAIEEELPEFLGRLATVNRAGIPISKSIVSLEDADFDTLNEQVEKLARDIRWNATTGDALRRFDRRIRSPAMTRGVVLLRKASEASGRVARVLEIASDDAEQRRKLNAQRRSQMSLYIIVIYISFVVFLVIVTILDTVFIPAIPTENVGDIPQLQSSFEPTEYQTLFYHATVVQGFFSGLIAGKMSSGRVSSGAKHSFIMVAIAYVVFTFFLQVKVI
ncbi:MAG: type II secretion system F family protein [Halobacteria archaeon]|nr:type II secretion system F family protein [Halobacteria archaeon]